MKKTEVAERELELFHEPPIIKGNSEQFNGRVDIRGPAKDHLALIKASAYLLKQMDEQGIESISVKLESYDSGNRTPMSEPLILKKGVLEIKIKPAVEENHDA